MNAVRIGDVLSGAAERPAAILSSFVMAVLLLAYLVAAVRSFIQVRRERRLASA